MSRFPAWLKQELPCPDTAGRLREIAAQGISTVCMSARCPNRSHCFERNHMAFMILGERCSRGCRFCAVEKSGGPGLFVDPDEPQRIASCIRALGISYAVVTSVTRDDLPDGGAGQFARVISAIRSSSLQAHIEVLIPDFSGSISSLKLVLEARPDVIAHNLETVPRLYARLRPVAQYDRSLEVLRTIKKLCPSMITKTSLMLGLGETEEELQAVFGDLCAVQCDILTLGQYLAPSAEQVPVEEFITPEKFDWYARQARRLGIRAVLSAPLARSSYRAQETFQELSPCTI